MTRRGTCGRCGLLVELDSLMRVSKHRTLTAHVQWCPGAGHKPMEALHEVRPVAPRGGAV